MGNIQNEQKIKLLSMTDFVLQQTKQYVEGSFQEKLNDTAKRFLSIINYANFLKQPLELWMFVPCDDNGNVLEKPREFKNKFSTFEKYQQAKERCLFEESKYDIGIIKDIIKCSKNIEDLITCFKLDLQITPTALKQIGL